MSSKPVQLGPNHNQVHIGMALANVALFAMYMGSSGAAAGLTALTASSALSFAKGWTLTNAIGGADMPVVITVLNSYR